VEGGGGDGEGSRSTNLWAEQVEKVATARTVAGGGANTEGANVSLHCANYTNLFLRKENGSTQTLISQTD
jgi:hypothetical protein